MTQLDQPLSGSAPDSLQTSAERDREQEGGHSRYVNIGTTERAISTAAGALLAIAGLSRRSIPGVIAAALGGGMIYRGVSGHCDVLAALGIDRSDRAGDQAEPQDYFERGIHVEQSMTINKEPWDLYQFWRKFENLPSIMSHLEEVRVIDEKKSHWVAKAPSIAGGKVEWDAEIINDEPNALIAWRSLAGADVDNAGSVRFVPAPGGDRGTEVKVVLDYIPPAGRLGKWIAKLMGEDPQHEVREDLRCFKRIMETGELPTTQGQPRGNCKGSGYRESDPHAI
jgi:uncharacterized membrane protein